MRSELLFLAMIAGACTHKEEAAVPAAEPREVTCAPVETRLISDSIPLRGVIAALPGRDSILAPQVSGRVVEMKVGDGDAVKKGQLLARIDAAVLEDQGKEADAVRARMHAERQSAEATLVRVQRVFEHGIAARQEVEDAQARLASAIAAEAEAQSAAHRANQQTSWSLIQAPFDGVVLKVLRRPGELVDGTSATPVLEVADPSQLELVADATAQDLVRMAKGRTATITSSALPGVSWQAEVSMVSAAVDRTTGLGLVRVRIDLASAEVKPPIGLFAVARISVGASRSALLVPKIALRSHGGSETEIVECGKDHIAHAHTVTAGVEIDELVEIKAGLTAGQDVLIEPVLGVQDNDPITVAP